MDSPFAQDNPGFPFRKPLEPQAAARPAALEGAPPGGPLRPFSAVDIAPPARPAAAAPAPAVSPFLETVQRPFVDADPPAPRPAPPAPARAREAPAPAPEAARQSHILPAAAVAAAAAPAPAPRPAAPAGQPRFFLTSTPAVEGHAVRAYLDVLSAEVVVPKDILFRNPAPYGDLHRLKAAEDALQRVKAKALEELAEKAKQAGADAVVGVRIAFVNLDTVCCLCSAVGTAVRF